MVSYRYDSLRYLKSFGFGTVVYLAALTGIDPTLYEAAAVDGARRWKQTLHITLPGIAPTIILMSVLSLGNVLNAGFDQIYNLYSPLVYETGDIIDTFVTVWESSRHSILRQRLWEFLNREFLFY